MSQNLKKIWIFIGMLYMCLPIFAHDFSYTYEGQTLMYTIIDEDAKTCETETTTKMISGNLIIPSIAKDGDTEYTVTSIGDYAFKDCDSLISVLIPQSITSIGESAFEDCNSLISVLIPHSVTSIGYGAFYGCYNLEKVAYPNTLNLFGGSQFRIAYDPSDVIIEDGVIYRSDKSAIYFVPISFEGEFIVPNTVTSIGEGAFAWCTSLWSILIPPSVTSIGYRAFYECSELKKAAYPNTFNKPFPDDTYYNIAYDPSDVIIEDGVIYRSDKSAIYFVPISFKAEFIVPNTVTSIGEGAFAWCTWSLKSILIPPSVSSIERGAFSGCEFRKAAYPDTLPYPFWSISYEYLAYNPSNVIIEDGFIYDFEKKSIYFSPLSLKGEFIIPNTIKSIGNNAFSYCRDLTSIEIPNSVSSIGSCAFRSCTGLTSIEIPNSVSSIGIGAFLGCSGLTSIEIPSSVSLIGGNSFAACDNLKEVKVNWIEPVDILNDTFPDIVYSSAILSAPDGTFSAYVSSEWGAFKNISIGGYSANKIISDGVFSYRLLDNPSNREAVLIGRYDWNLTEASIPERFIDESDPENPIRYYITGIGPNAFENSYNLKKVYFNSRSVITTIGSYSFYKCKVLTSITLPNSVKSIGTSAFEYCEKLTEIILPNSLQSIGANAFKYCYKLPQVILPNTIKSIGTYAFFNCEKLTEIIIPNSVKFLGAFAFSGCDRLNSVTISNSLTTIDEGTFYYGEQLTEVILPPSIKTIGASAFAKNRNLSSIIMGPNLRDIGERAFDECKASTIYITAQTPPIAPNNTFSNYSGELFLQGSSTVEAYYDSFTCWDRFNSNVMIEPTELKYTGPNKLAGKPGDTFQLSATLIPDNVTLPQLFWRSTNPEIATVDANGLVTLHIDTNKAKSLSENNEETTADNTCKIIVESLYANGPKVEVNVNSSSDIDDITTDDVERDAIDFDIPMEVYNINGIKIATSLNNINPGIYIIRQNSSVKKIVVK